LYRTKTLYFSRLIWGEAERTKKGRRKRKKRREGRTKKKDLGRPPRERAGRRTNTVRREREREAEKKTHGSLCAGRDPQTPSPAPTFSGVWVIKSSKG
jgi:hypothetical protein